MASDRFLTEIASIRRKYSSAVFDLERSKESIKSLELRNTNLVEECEQLKQTLRKHEQEKISISSSLDEATKKLNVLSLENKSLQLRSSEKNESKKIEVVPKENSSSLKLQISELKKQNRVLEARLKQAEFGIEQNRDFKLSQKQEIEKDDVCYEVEKLLKHRKKKNKLEFFVRWEGFGAEEDSWVPEDDLCCPDMLATYKRKYKI